VGDIICCYHPDRMVIHRLVKKANSTSGITLVTKGDSCPKCDRPLRNKDVVGKVVSVERYTETMQLNQSLWNLMKYLLKVYRLTFDMTFQTLCFLKRSSKVPRISQAEFYGYRVVFLFRCSLLISILPLPKTIKERLKRIVTLTPISSST
jgi:hypothetical protein